jgi:GTP cyclohydrolase I
VRRIKVSNAEKLEQAAKLIIEALGENPRREGLIDTPRRFRDMFLEDLGHNGITPQEALKEMVMEEHYDQVVIVKDIPVRSLCEHHLLSWYGRASIGYIPREKTVGLSKLTRCVEAASRGLTIQERVTNYIADAIEEVLQPIGIMVIIEAVHLCVLVRGVKSEIQRFTTSAARGAFLENQAARQEFLTLLMNDRGLL